MQPARRGVSQGGQSETGTSAYSLIRQAILDRNQIVAVYGGHLREVCPHIVGMKNGRAHALFYQFGGTSNSGLSPIGSPDNWRCVLVEKLTEVSVRPGPWYTAAEPPRQQNCVDVIDVTIVPLAI